jgi:hypothetical protein
MYQLKNIIKLSILMSNLVSEKNKIIILQLSAKLDKGITNYNSLDHFTNNFNIEMAFVPQSLRRNVD